MKKKYAISEYTLGEEAKDELNKVKEIEKIEMNIHILFEQNFRTVSTYGKDIYSGAITLEKADKDQSHLLVEILNFKKQAKPQNSEKNQQKKDILKNIYALFDARERVLDAFESKIFPIKTEGTGYSGRPF